MIFFSRKKQEPMPPAPNADSDIVNQLDNNDGMTDALGMAMPSPPQKIQAEMASEAHVNSGSEEPSDDLDKLNSEIDSLEKEIKETEANISKIDKELSKLGKKSK